jgi:hypothetical protein
MPLFSSRRRNNTYSASAGKQPSSPVTQSNRRRGIGSSRSRSPGYADDRSGSSLSDTHDPYDGNDSSRFKGDHAGTGRRSRGLFRRRRDFPSDRHTHVAQDQTLMNARAKISNAEAAERSADAALNAARSAAHEAKDHVKALEREAVEEYVFFLARGNADFLTNLDSARRAKMKQSEAKNVRKTLRGLGRHG